MKVPNDCGTRAINFSGDQPPAVSLLGLEWKSKTEGDG
jgi:hypothetical protein